MKSIFSKKWLLATLIRSLKTFAECMSGFLITGAAIQDINWGLAVSVSAVSTLLCVCTCVKGLPEVGERG